MPKPATRLLAILLTLTYLAPTALAQDKKPLAPIEFQTETLDNGLRVIYAPLRQAPVVHVRVLYHVGSKDERPDRQGFAHMFEHMMFRGSAHVKPEQHMQLINSVGGISNAFTSFDQTTYVNTVPSEHTEMALYLEADRMASFKVSEEIYKTERKVVAEEWRMRMNQPYGSLWEEAFKLLFAKHSYRWTPIGNMGHLRAAAVNELQDFFNTYYVPNNAVLVVAGDIDVAKTKDWVKKYYGWIPKGPTPPRLSPREPEQTEGKKSVVPAPVPLPAVMVGTRVGDYKSDDQYALTALDEILGSGRSSRLDRRLVQSDNPLAQRVNSLFMQLEEGGIMGAQAILLPGKDPNEVEKILKEEIALVAEKGVTEDELNKAKSQARQNIITGRKTAEDIASTVGEEALFADDPSRANQQLAKIEALTPADIQAVAKKYLQANRLTTLQMVPDPTGQLAKKAATQATMTAEVTPASAPVTPRAITFPADYPKEPPVAQPGGAARFAKGEESTIAGAKVIVMNDARLPMANFTVTLRRGSHSESKGKEGLSGIVNEMVRRGVNGYDYATLSETLESRAIQLGITDGGDYTRLTVSCPSSQLDEAVRLARLVLREPTFPADEFPKLKNQAVSGLMRALASPTTVAQIESDRQLYGDTPLGRSQMPKTLQSITLDDVKDFYAKVYRPDESILVFSGDVSVEKGRELADQLLAGWDRKGLIEPPKYDLPGKPDQRQILLVDNPDGKQATVRIATPAFTVHSDEKYAGSLVNQILSGGIESRVMRYVRAEKGLAYHAHGVFSPGRQAGAFVGGTDTAIETTADAIEAMFKVFNDVRQDKVTPEELSESKRRVAGRLVMQMQTIEAQAEQRLNIELNGYPLDYFDQYAAHINAVTDDQILALMKKYVDPAKTNIVVVAPAAKTQDQLKRLGEVKTAPMPAKRDDLLKDAAP